MVCSSPLFTSPFLSSTLLFSPLLFSSLSLILSLPTSLPSPPLSCPLYEFYTEKLQVGPTSLCKTQTKQKIITKIKQTKIKITGKIKQGICRKASIEPNKFYFINKNKNQKNKQKYKDSIIPQMHQFPLELAEV